MSGQIGDSMHADEITDVLERQGHGVLSLSRGDDGYGIPVSYAYDLENERLIFEFVHVGESKKRDFLGSSDEVTLTTYDYRDPTTWMSVIATGTLTPLSEDEVSDRSAALFFSQADDAAKNLRWVEDADAEREWWGLDIREVTGRRGEHLPDPDPAP